MAKLFASIFGSFFMLSVGLIQSMSVNAASPTPTPTATISALQIVSRMMSADREKNTLHIALQLDASIPGVLNSTVHLAGDISQRPVLVSETVTATGTGSGFGPKSSHGEIVVVGNQAAIRKDVGSWNCKPVQSLLGQYFDVLKNLNPHVESAELAGDDTIGGTSVWHVRAKASETLSGKSLTVPIDLFVSRADFTLVREHLRLTMDTRQGVLSEALTLDLSRFGEPVHIAIPTACSVALEFSIQRIALENNNAKPDWSLKRPSPSHVPRGTVIQVAAYMLYWKVRAKTMIHECAHVWHNGKVTFISCDHDIVRLGDDGGQQAFTDTFTPWHTGHFRLTTVAWSGKVRHQKTIWFWVDR